MKKVIKIFSLILAVTAAVMMSLTLYGNETIPDTVTVIEKEISFSGIFSVEQPEKTNEVMSVLSRGGEKSAGSEKATVKLLKIMPVKSVNIQKKSRRYVAVGGELIGIKLMTRGVIIVGTESFESDGVTLSPAEEAGIKTGDILLSINGNDVTDNASLIKSIETGSGQPMTMTLSRDGSIYTTVLTPKKQSGTMQYKGGLWVRDSTSGIGTLTYCDIENGTIGALGHGIFDADAGTVMPVSNGAVFSASVLGVTKGCPGTAGELGGVIGSEQYGTLELNCDEGIYGKLVSVREGAQIMPVAVKSEVREGSAQIIATVDSGAKKYYNIEIEKINKDTSGGEKNMVIKITDESLIGVTGGVVQGMSGCPIIQDSRLIGAVTHVFLNDPTKGYAIFAENMLASSDALAQNQYNSAS